MAKTQEYPGYSDMKKALDAESYNRMYIFFGQETYLRDYCLSRLKAQLVDGPCEQFNHHVFDGSMDLASLGEALDAYPMMSDHSLVVVTDYDIFAQNESSRNTFISLISDLPDYCCLVFVYDTISYKADGRQKKLCAAIDQYAKCIEFRQQSQTELTKWIIGKVESLGSRISTKTAQQLIYLAGDLMTGLSSEIEKLSAYAGGGEITSAMVEEMVEPSVEVVVFDMTNAIADGKFGDALVKLQYLFQKKEEPISLLSVMAGQIRQYHTALLAMREGKDKAYLQKLWGMSPYATEIRMKAAKRFSLAWCKRALRLCVEADLKMKSTGYDKERQLEMLLLELAKNEDH